MRVPSGAGFQFFSWDHQNTNGTIMELFIPLKYDAIKIALPRKFTVFIKVVARGVYYVYKSKIQNKWFMYFIQAHFTSTYE